MSYFKVVNLNTDSAVYFNDETGSVFDSPITQVRKYVNRNKNNRLSIFIESSKPRPFPRWEPFYI